MDGLNILLPPFSPDYSGAASVFFDLNSLIVLHDADGCTSNYASYDEPRWYGSRKPIFSSCLRTIDAIMGNDDKLIARIQEAAERIKPEVIAVVGSPVPMIIGTDFNGIAMEIENATGIPTFGFHTTGLNYYNVGASGAFLSLAKRFMKTPVHKQERSLNILGLLPLDYGNGENDDAIRKYIEDGGWNVIASLMMDTSLEKLKQAPEAAVNLVVSQTGLELAVWMEKKFGIPYVVGSPIGKNPAILEYLDRAVSEKNSYLGSIEKESEERKILWIGEQVIGNSLREYIEEAYGIEGMVVATPYWFDRRIARKQDLNLNSEAKMLREMKKPEYRCILADPLLKALLRRDDVDFYEVPQVAISSKLCWDRGFSFLGEDLEKIVDGIRRSCK